MARFEAKTYYLFRGLPNQKNFIGAYHGLAAAKEAGASGGNAASWKKSTFRHSHDENDPWLSEWYGGSGNDHTICDYLPKNVVLGEAQKPRRR